jgi:hypothetical protein
MMGELENEWTHHLAALSVVTEMLTRTRRCKGFANAGMCFGCPVCYRGILSDEFKYIIGGGKIRLWTLGTVPQVLDRTIAAMSLKGA